MFRSKKSSLGRSVETFESIIGTTLCVQGDLVISQSLRIDGTVNGNIYQAEGQQATIALAPTAKVTGNINVQHVIISGYLKGNIVSTGRVELVDSARVEGNITYGSLGIAVGAGIIGQVNQMDAMAESSAAKIIEKIAHEGKAA